MSISTEITRINNNIASAYQAVSDMGGTLPATQNTANLPSAIATIPSTYKLLKCLILSGTQYINTGLIEYGTYENDVQLTSDGNRQLAGFSGGDGLHWEVTVAGNYKSTYYDTGVAVGNRDIVIFTKASDGKVTFMINGQGRTINNTALLSTYPYRIGTLPAFNYGLRGKVFGLKHYNVSNVLDHDFKPVMRVSDNVLGMLDVMTNTFYTNAGSGTFGYEELSGSESSGSVKNQIKRINDNIASSYDACKVLGRTMPSNMNSSKLANTIRGLVYDYRISYSFTGTNSGSIDGYFYVNSTKYSSGSGTIYIMASDVVKLYIYGHNIGYYFDGYIKYDGQTVQSISNINTTKSYTPPTADLTINVTKRKDGGNDYCTVDCHSY